ncbi:MAG: hypothetical protein ACR2JP_02080 [Acidimicrobiia bacterium]
MGVASVALAEFAAGDRFSAPGTFDGFRGNQNIRTDPATVAGIGFVHPVQMDIGVLGGDFVAIGTSNGLGADGCADDYDAKWTVYTDGVDDGEYFCNDEQLDAYGVGANPAFSITHGFCPSEILDRWLMSFGGTLWACYVGSSSVARRAIAGLETTGGSTVDRNIDVKYTNLNVNRSGNTDWILFRPSEGPVGDFYEYEFVSNTKFNTFLPPLD